MIVSAILNVDFFAPAEFLFKNITVVGSLNGDENDLAECVELCHKHHVKGIVSTFTMDQQVEMLDGLKGRAGKSVMVF